MSDLEQKRRTVRVLELLSESFEAHRRDDDEAFRAALDAATGCDDAAFAGIQIGMTIGEIPNPERDWPAWCEYVSVNQEGLARMEAEEAAGDDFLADRHADLDPGEGGMMADADYYDRTSGAGDSGGEEHDGD